MITEAFSDLSRWHSAVMETRPEGCLADICKLSFCVEENHVRLLLAIARKRIRTFWSLFVLCPFTLLWTNRINTVLLTDLDWRMSPSGLQIQSTVKKVLKITIDWGRTLLTGRTLTTSNDARKTDSKDNGSLKFKNGNGTYKPEKNPTKLPPLLYADQALYLWRRCSVNVFGC